MNGLFVEGEVPQVVEDLDALAGNISFKHAKSNDNSEQKPLLVTASIDRIILGHRANLKDDIELRCVSVFRSLHLQIPIHM